MKLAKEIFRTFLIFFSGVLLNLSFSGSLNIIYNIILFIGAFMIIAYIIVNETILTKYQEKIDILEDKEDL